jgi:hypothetical protein
MSKMSVFVKGTVIATVVALAFSSVAFAKGRVAKAPATTATSSQVNVQFEQNSWKDELAWLKFDNAVLGRIDRVLEGIVGRFDKDLNSKRPDDRLGGRLGMMLKDTQALLAKAEATATTHAGFDASGKITDQAQALKSVQTLGAILDQLRGTFMFKLEHLL